MTPREKSKHTPGPWRYDGTDEIVAADGTVIGCVWGLEPGLGDEDANGHLIAAAPELLTALDELTHACQSADWTSGDPITYMNVKARMRKAAEVARAAIAKARGEDGR